jgi:hypothetical protein
MSMSLVIHVFGEHLRVKIANPAVFLAQFTLPLGFSETKTNRHTKIHVISGKRKYPLVI